MPAAYAAGGRLYVAQRVVPPVNFVRNELIRVDPESGRLMAVRQLDSTFDQALLADGALWVGTGRSTRTGLGRAWLWRLDPRTLAVRSRLALSAPNLFGGSATMALAGGWLWVASSNHLVRISPADGRITERIAIDEVASVAASPSGQVLLVSEGGERSEVQRRDPRTGALLATSGLFEGAAAPYIGGVVDGGAWISQSGGMMGSVERLDIKTLRITGFTGAPANPGITGPPQIFGTNGIEAQLIDGILWVSQPAGGPQRNYCGDPRTAVSRAPIKLPAWGMFLTADANAVYYVADGSARREQLDREPLDPRCRSAPPVETLLVERGRLPGPIGGDCAVGAAEARDPPAELDHTASADDPNRSHPVLGAAVEQPGPVPLEGCPAARADPERNIPLGEQRDGGVGAGAQQVDGLGARLLLRRGERGGAHVRRNGEPGDVLGLAWDRS